jgi:hypothetical protein
VFPRRLNADSRRFGTLYQFHLLRQFDAVYCIELPKNMELIEGSETSAISNQTPGKHPKENILHVKHGESLKSRKFINISTLKLFQLLSCGLLHGDHNIPHCTKLKFVK